MKYKEAQKMLIINEHLRGNIHNGRYVSDIIIVPTISNGLALAIDVITRMGSLQAFNMNYNDFEIIALLDFDDYSLTGKLYFCQANQLQGFLLKEQ